MLCISFAKKKLFSQIMSVIWHQSGNVVGGKQCTVSMPDETTFGVTTTTNTMRYLSHGNCQSVNRNPTNVTQQMNPQMYGNMVPNVPPPYGYMPGAYNPYGSMYMQLSYPQPCPYQPMPQSVPPCPHLHPNAIESQQRMPVIHQDMNKPTMQVSDQPPQPLWTQYTPSNMQTASQQRMPVIRQDMNKPTMQVSGQPPQPLWNQYTPPNMQTAR